MCTQTQFMCTKTPFMCTIVQRSFSLRVVNDRETVFLVGFKTQTQERAIYSDQIL